MPNGKKDNVWMCKSFPTLYVFKTTKHLQEQIAKEKLSIKTPKA